MSKNDKWIDAFTRALKDITEPTERSLLYMVLTGIIAEYKKGTYQDNFLMVFPYEEERELERFFQAEIDNLDNCETLCQEVVVKCITSGIPFPIMYLQFLQKKINKSKSGEIFFGYSLDLKELSEDVGEQKCVSQCARTLFSLLSRVTNESTVSYTLLMKKISRRGYFKFIEHWIYIFSNCYVNYIFNIFH